MKHQLTAICVRKYTVLVEANYFAAGQHKNQSLIHWFQDHGWLNLRKNDRKALLQMS